MAWRAPRSSDELGEITDLVRRVVASRVGRSEEVEDVVQETLVRVAGVQDRLDRKALPGYAVVTARNVIATRHRQHDRDRRHMHRLVEYTNLGTPEELTLRREENDALAAALQQLPATDRELLVAHEVDGVKVEELGERAESSPAAIGMRLARARARLRLEFVLAMRGVDHVPSECRAVLMALSAGDTRRQERLDAGKHLARCATCASLSAPLVERRRAIAGWLPIGLLPGAWAAFRRVMRTPRGQATAAVGMSVAVAVGIVAVAVTDHAPTRSPSSVTTTAAPVASNRLPSASLQAGTASLLPLPPGGLAPYSSDAITARNLIVLAVVPGEGAWVGLDAASRLWVEFTDRSDTAAEPGPLPAIVQVGRRIDFTCGLSDNPAEYARQLGLDGNDQAALDAAGFHAHADPASVVLGDTT